MTTPARTAHAALLHALRARRAALSAQQVEYITSFLSMAGEEEAPHGAGPRGHGPGQEAPAPAAPAGVEAHRTEDR